jgi:hypothetical protein
MEEKKIIKKDNAEINLQKNTLNSVNQNTLDLCEEIKSTFPSYAIDKYSQTYNRSSVFDFSLLNLLKMPDTFENISNFGGAISNQKKNESLAQQKPQVSENHSKTILRLKSIKSINSDLEEVKNTFEMSQMMENQETVTSNTVSGILKKRKISEIDEIGIENYNLKKSSKNQNIESYESVGEHGKKINIIGKSVDFESDSDSISNNFSEINLQANLTFIQEKKYCGLLNLNNYEKFTINFCDFMKERNSKEEVVKTHQCKFCTATFKKHTALGGHIAKNHPNKSKSYKRRKKSLENRKIERNRLKFLKKLE